MKQAFVRFCALSLLITGLLAACNTNPPVVATLVATAAAPDQPADAATAADLRARVAVIIEGDAACQIKDMAGGAQVTTSLDGLPAQIATMLSRA